MTAAISEHGAYLVRHTDLYILLKKYTCKILQNRPHFKLKGFIGFIFFFCTRG